MGLRGHQVQSLERSEERRRALLMSAARAFAESGYNVATLDDVAERCGVTKGVIYYYFRSKEDIYVEIMAATLRDAVARVEAIIARALPADETLAAVVEDGIRHQLDGLDHYVLLFRAQASDLSRESREQLQMLRRRYWRLIRGLLAKGVEEGLFARRDTRLMANTAIYAAGSFSFWFNPGGSLTSDQLVRELTEQIMAGVLAATPDAKAPVGGQKE